MALAAVLLFSIFPFKGYGAKFMIGCGFGYSVSLKDKRIDTFGSVYRTARPGTCVNPSIGIMFRGHFSIAAEALYQNYGTADRLISDGTVVATWPAYNDFLYIGVTLEYRFFEEIRKSWNPYVSVGFYGYPQIGPFAGGPPYYPASGSINAGVGTRIRIAGPLYLNPRVAFVSGISSLSLRAGLDLIL